MSSKNNDKTKMVRGKSISLNIKEEGVLEGNVIQIPFIAEYRHKNNPITSIEYEWETKSSTGNNIKRGIEVSGHGRYGVPTLREKEVLRCLHNIFIAQKTKGGICELKDPEDCTNDDYAITFTINSLCREMGYKSPCNQTRNNVKRSLSILVATTIFNRHNGGLYDPEKKEYIQNQDKAFHLIETLIEEDKVDDEGNIIKDLTQIRLSEFVYKSLYHNYRLIYKKSRVESITHLGSRTLYQLALQWSNNGVTYARVDKLAEHIPMRDGINMVEKRKYIKACLDRLDKTDFVDISISRSNIVTFKFKDVINSTNISVDDMFCTYDEMLKGIVQLGYSKNEAKQLIDQKIMSLDSVQKALRQAYGLQRQDNNLNARQIFSDLYHTAGNY